MMIEAPLKDIKDLMKYYGNETRPIAHFPFNFLLLDVSSQMNGKEILDLVNTWSEHLPPGQWPTTLVKEISIYLS
jgi:hypothetical protein